MSEHFAAVEHVEFRALANGADDIERFLEFTRARPPVRALLDAHDGVVLLARIRTLAQRKTDPKFLHPDDVACAVYLDLLFRLKQDRLAQEAWALCQPHAGRMYWTNLVARSINQRATAVGVIPGEVPTEAVPTPPPPPDLPLVTADTLAAAFYDLYNAAVQELAPADKKPPARPPWVDLPADHPTRKVIQASCDRLLARMAAVPRVTIPTPTDEARKALEQWLRDGKIAARLVWQESAASEDFPGQAAPPE